MLLEARVFNVSAFIQAEFDGANRELVVDGSQGAVARRESAGYFNVFYKLLSTGAAENYFVRDPNDIAVFVEALANAATRVAASRTWEGAGARFCFRDCFVYRTNCFDAGNARKPWFCALCVDFDTPPNSDKTRKPDLPLTKESVAELVRQLAPFVEGCDLTQEPYVAYGSNEFADKSVSLHLIFYECVLDKTAAGKMTKQLSQRIGELPICRDLYVQPDFSIYTSGLKPLGMDKQVNKQWRGDSQWIIDIHDGSDLSHTWEEIFERTCIVVTPEKAATRRKVVWRGDLEPQHQRVRRENVAPVVFAAAIGENFEERIRAAMPQFADCAFRTGSRANVLVPMQQTFCPYKNAAHDKVQVGFFCDDRTRSVTVRCFSADCQQVAGYPLRIAPPPVDDDELEATALELFKDYCLILYGAPVAKAMVCRIPREFDADFVIMSPTDFKTMNMQHRHVSFSARGKRTEQAFTDLWMKSSRKITAYGGFRMFPLESRVLVPVGELTAINSWRGFPPDVELASEFDPETCESRCSLFLLHLRENICGGDVRLIDWVTKWLAWLVQKLDRKPGVALWCKGKGGQGKNEFYEYLVRMLGKWHTYKSSDAHAIDGSFNSHLANARLLLLEEQQGGTDPKIQNAFNDFITCRVMEVKQKFVPNREEPNYTCLLGFANEAFSGLRQKTGERRYQTVEVHYRLAQDKFQFFPAMQRERDSGGAGALLAYLRRVELGDWFPERFIVQTEAGWMDQLRSLPKLRQWWFYKLKHGRLFDGSFMDADGSEKDGEVFGKTAAKFLFVQSAQKEVAQATDAQVWIYIKQGFPPGRPVRGQPWFEPNGRRGEIEVPSLAECKRVFEEYHGYPEFIWTAKETF